MSSSLEEHKLNLLIMVKEQFNTRIRKIWGAFFVYAIVKTGLWWQGYFAKFFHNTKYTSIMLAVSTTMLVEYDFRLQIEKHNLVEELNKETQLYKKQ